MAAKIGDDAERTELGLQAQLREALGGEEPPPCEPVAEALCALLRPFYERAGRSAVFDEPDLALDFALLGANVKVSELADVFRGFAQGLAPSVQVLERMLGVDLVFGAWARLQHGLRQLAGVVHARPVRAGQSLGASDLVERDGEPAPALFTPPRAWQDCVVCHHAVTHPDFQMRGLHVTQALILQQVLPYLRDDARTRDVPWLTSSPMTDFTAAGRGLVAGGLTSSRLDQLLLLCDEQLRRFGSGPRGSLRGLIALSMPYLREEGYPISSAGSAGEDPWTFFAQLYHALPTHRELMQGDHQQAAARVARLYAQPQGLDPRLQAGQRAAFTLFFLAAAFTQLTYDGESGEPQDPVRKFHLRNGADLHPAVGPLPGSRTQDVAALRFGQIFVYTRRWVENQRSHRERVEERVRAGLRGVQIDLQGAALYLGNLMDRVGAFAAP